MHLKRIYNPLFTTNTTLPKVSQYNNVNHVELLICAILGVVTLKVFSSSTSPLQIGNQTKSSKDTIHSYDAKLIPNFVIGSFQA